MKKPGGAVEARSASEASTQLAIDWFRKALGQSAGDDRIARQANYLIGVGLAEQGNLPAAVAQLERTERLYPDSPEYIAALFQEADIYRRMGRHAESVAAYRRLMSAYVRLDEFHNPWISSPQIQSTIQGACRNYVKAGKYNTAVALAKSLAGPFPKAESLKLIAEIYRTWGDNLMDEADRLPPEKAEPRRKEARLRCAMRATAIRTLPAKCSPAATIRSSFGTAAAAYLAGHDFRSAANLLRMYLRNEARLHNAQALTDLGEAELSLGQMERAVRTLQECIQQHPRDVAIYRAGCWAAGHHCAWAT